MDGFPKLRKTAICMIRKYKKKATMCEKTCETQNNGSDEIQKHKT